MTYGSGSFSGKYLLSSLIGFELIECRKYRHGVHRPSYNRLRACHHQAINRCCCDSKLPTLLFKSFFPYPNSSQPVSPVSMVSLGELHTYTSRHRCQPPLFSIGPVDLTLGQFFSPSNSPLVVVISHVFCRYFESRRKY